MSTPTVTVLTIYFSPVFFSGRRACVGEGLAKMELFLFFAGLLRKFVFQAPPGVDKSDLDLTADVGFTLNPMPHLVCAVPCERSNDRELV